MFTADGFMSEMSQRYGVNGVPTDLPVMSDAMFPSSGLVLLRLGYSAVTMMGALGANFDARHSRHGLPRVFTENSVFLVEEPSWLTGLK